MTRVHHALIIVIAVGLAALFLVFGWPAVAAALVVVMLAALVQVPLVAKARSLMPHRPASSQRWLDNLWVSRVVPFALIAALPMWLGAELGDQFGTDLGKRTALQVIGVAVALAVVELAKAINQDGALIDEWIGQQSKDLFEAMLPPQFDDRQPPGPLPAKERNPQGEEVPSELWLLVHDTRNRGWTRDVRQQRAHRIQELLDARTAPVGWVPVTR